MIATCLLRMLEGMLQSNLKVRKEYSLILGLQDEMYGMPPQNDSNLKTSACDDGRVRQKG